MITFDSYIHSTTTASFKNITMFKINWISFLVLYFCLDYAQLKHVKDDYQWDLLIFTQHWPETVCQVWTHHKPSHSCTMPNKHNTWTIHGVWPTRLGSVGPAFCNKTWLFDPEQVKPIEDDLEQSWTNIEKGTPLYDFWAHEWNKHGTCAAILDAFNSELKYFSKGISWLKTYSMTDILNASNIVPSSNKLYKLADIYSAVKKGIGKNPVVECKFEDGKQYIFEIRICFDKKLDLEHCDGVVHRSEHQGGILSNCKASTGILYPLDDTQPKKMYVQLYKFTNWLQWLTL